ncbi:hypothetical protein H8E77_38190 [bacterium]|nr:hypothetical protein [bacterium]
MPYNLIDRIAEELAEEVSLSKGQIESVVSALAKFGALNMAVYNTTALRSKEVRSTEFLLVDESDGITKMTFEEYLVLPIERRHSLALELQKRNWHSIQSELIRRNAQWMLVCGGSVFEYSSNWKELPTDEKIKKIGHQQNKVPLVFVRNPLVEETAWSPLPADDWYPTIPVYFGRAQWDDEQLVQQGINSFSFLFDQTFSFRKRKSLNGLFIISDFDTGAPFIFADNNQLIQEQILDWELVHNPFLGSHLGNAYAFFITELRVGVADEVGNVKSAPMQCRCVMNWASSPLRHVNPQRQALVGRNLLLILAFQVNLNGANLSTRLLITD